MYVDRQVARRAHSRSKTKQIRRFKLLLGLLVLCLIGVSMQWILSAAKLDAAESDKLALDADLRRTEKTLEETRIRLEQRESELVDLVENRIPGLDVLEFNELIDTNNRYVLNVTFAQSGVKDQEGIEYHAMLRNETERMILPNVKIFLFDEFGLQVGVANLEKMNATRIPDMAELSPGETRSYHANIDIERNAVPKYYMIHVQ